MNLLLCSSRTGFSFLLNLLLCSSRTGFSFLLCAQKKRNKEKAPAAVTELKFFRFPVKNKKLFERSEFFLFRENGRIFLRSSTKGRRFDTTLLRSLKWMFPFRIALLSAQHCFACYSGRFPFRIALLSVGYFVSLVGVGVFLCCLLYYLH